MSEASVNALAAAMSAVGTIIAAVIGYFALKATKGAAFSQLTVTQLFGLLTSTRETRRAYVELLNPFENVAAKRDARRRWLEKRESVTVSLGEMRLLLDEVQALATLWEKVEAQEDSYVVSEHLTIDANAKETATKLYDQVHVTFVTALTTVMKSVR